MAWNLDIISWIVDLASLLFLLIACYAYFRYRELIRHFRLQLAFYLIIAGLLVLALPLNVDTAFAKFFSLPLPTNAAISDLHLVLDGLGSGFLLLGILQFPNRVLPGFRQRFERQEKQNYRLSTTLKKLQGDLQSQKTLLDNLKGELSEAYVAQYSQELVESNNVQLYRQLFDYSPIFCFSLSDKNEIDDANSFACDRLGYSFGELISSRFLDIVAPEQRRQVESQLSKLRMDEDAIHDPFETRLVSHGGESISVTVLRHSVKFGDVKKFFVFCQDVTESKELSESLAYQASHDELTKLHNRRAFEAYLNSRLQQIKDGELPVALIYIDVDQLKVVNDTCGHFAGDQLLLQMVFLLNEVCDQQSDFFARLGGDEFAVIKFGCSQDDAVQLSEQLRSTAEDFVFSWEGKHFRQSVSIGVAISDTRLTTTKELLSAADAACYSAKESGRNQVAVHNASIDFGEDNRQGMMWVSRLQAAVSNGDFRLYFQPIVRLDAPHVPYIHYEVLIQYIDENGTAIPPGRFLPSADRFGVSNMIDLWVVTEVLDFLQKNPDHTKMLQCCSINLTSHSLSSHRTRSAIMQLVKSSTFPASKICFEITESTAIRNLTEAVEFIRALRDLGCRFALDDFGTGFSSFAYLKNLDVDYVKIDGSFVRDIVDDNIDKAMIKAISDIAKALSIKTIAEYVENDNILRELRKVNVDLGQGFGIAKPMPMDALRDFYHIEPLSEVLNKT